MLKPNLILYMLLFLFTTLLHVLMGNHQNGISYGAILNLTEGVQCEVELESHWRYIVKFAVQEAIKFNPETVVVNGTGEVEPYSTYNCSIMKVVYTKNGKTPALFHMMHPYEINQVIEAPLIWGQTYKFKVRWPFMGKSSYEHSFTVNEYIDSKLYLYEHTFYQIENVETEVDEGSSYQQNIDPNTQLDLVLQSSTTACSSIEFHHLFKQHFTSLNQCPLKRQQKYDLPEGRNHNLNLNELKLLKSNVKNSPYLTNIKNISIDFSILSYNIWNTNTVKQDSSTAKLYKERIKHLVKLCKVANPDIIAFQEVRFEDGRGGSYGPNQVKHLAALLKQYQYIYQPAQIQEHGLPKRIEEGVAIFSRYPILKHDFLLLSRHTHDVADTHQRILLHAQILVPEFGPIHVFNTHLSLSHIARQRTVVEIWKHLQKYTEPVFLMGDFNAEAHNDEVRFLSGLVKLHGVTTTGLQDIWTLKHGRQDPGFTFSTLDNELTKRIDLIFMKEHDNIRFIDVERIDDGQRGENAASDHVGLLSKFKGIVSTVNR